MTTASFTNLRRWGPLFLISSLGLFFEIAVIRWYTSEIRVLAYFKNLILLAAFLGFSIGFAMVGKGRDFRRSFLPLWTLFSLVVAAMSWFTGRLLIFYPGSADELLWMVQETDYWTSLGIFLATALVFFMMCVLLFIPLGQATGEEMAQHPPVKAYIVNILASLAGVWAFSLLSYLRTPPWVWFAVGLGGFLLYSLRQKWLSWQALALSAVSLVAIAIVGWQAVWSPYNRLVLSELSLPNRQGTQQVQLGYLLDVQQTLYQNALDLSPASLERLKTELADSDYQIFAEGTFMYSLPYRITPPGSSVLVVGSGMGNDVAAALRGGASRVDAVDIDPVIVDQGRALHPELPYADPRVNVYIDDARSFFNTTDQKYDWVVFGGLDSHGQLSGVSSVRLDSFVYTLESFRQARSLLKPGGTLALNFLTNDWIQERIGRMLVEVFGADQVYYREGPYGTSYIVGDLSPAQQADGDLAAWHADPAYDGIPLSTDDWPNLYVRARVIPNGYWQTMLVIAAACILLMRRTFPGALRPDAHFFLLGAAFLLIEFKSVTELALLFGSTWFVNSLAISGVLVMALFANLYVLKQARVNIRLAYALLFAGLAVSYFFPLEWLAGWPAALKALLSTVLLSLPLLFAGVIFSESLRRYGETARPLASNFLGSAAGGMLEYASLLWGIKSLYVIAAGLYLAALAAFTRRGKSGG